MNYLEWQKRMDPEMCPFRDGAEFTEEFGVRTNISIGSPLHLGPDRAEHTGIIQAPWDGVYEWRLIPGSVAGSVLQIVPIDGQGDVELQVFHTVAGEYDMQIDDSCKRGQVLPLKPGDIGLSMGIHTHSELIFRFSEDLVNQLRDLCGELLYFADEETDSRIEKQKMEWGITEVADHFMVRRWLPDYRTPHWGDTATIHVDTKWALKI